MQQQDRDLRSFRRLQMFTGVFLVQGERAYLSELTNVSAGGVSVKRPGTWHSDPEGQYHLYFVLDQDRILCVKSRVIHEQDDLVGLSFEPGSACTA